MSLISEVRSRARHVVGPVLAICAVAYFAFHAMQGDRGLIALLQLNQRIDIARAQLARTGQQRTVLAHRVQLLNRSGLDPDMLDERARLMLNYGHPNETVIFRRPAPERR